MLNKNNFYNSDIWGKIKFISDYIVANNHILNTLAISLVEFLFGTHYDEFAVRLPVLLFFALYLFTVWNCYKKSIISFTCAVLLCANYYLNEFYGLARGYGFAHTFLFLACVAYALWRSSNFNSNKFLIACMTFLLFAASANTISLMIFPAFGVLSLFRLYQNNNLKKFLLRHKYFVTLFFITAFALTAYHFFISFFGKPLAGKSDSFYYGVIMTHTAGFINNILLANILAVFVLSAAAIAFLFLILKDSYKNCDFVLMLIIFILTNFLMQFLTHKGYMAERAALPFYGFIILSLNELFRNAINKLNFNFPVKKISAAICALCMILYCVHINVHSTRDWDDNYTCRDKIIKAYMTGQNYIPDERHWAVEKFYDDKYAEIIANN